jgi:hypothetical protein
LFGTSPSEQQRTNLLIDAPSSGGPGAPVWTEGAAPLDALMQAEADAKHAVVVQTWQQAIRQENDPSKILAYGPAFRATNAERAAAFADPQFGSQWAAARDAEAKQLISARFDEVSREQTLANTEAWLDRLNTSALHSAGDDTVRLIDTGNRLIQGLKGAGHIDETAARDMRRHCVQNYAKAWIELRPPQERLALLGNDSTQDDAQPDAIAESTRRTGTAADFLPPQERARLENEAQAEVDRNTALRSWDKADEYEQSMAQASRGDPKPPPSRTAIQADPDVDDLTRARLLKQHDAMQRKLDAFRLAKAEYDKPNGRKFSIINATDRDFVEQIYIRLGADTAALHTVVNRTGMMPESAIATMRGDLASGDAARVQRTVEQLDRISRDFPNLLGKQEADDDLQNAATQYRYEIGRGATPEDAIKRIIHMRSPEHQQSLKANSNKDDEAAKETAKITSLFDLDQSFAGDPVSMAIMYMTYREVAQDRLLATGDPALAKAQALDQLKAVAHLTNAKFSDENRHKAAWPESGSPTLAQRAYYNALSSFYTGTTLGSAILAQAAAERRMVESGASDEELLREFYPALLANQPGQRGHRRAALESLKSAPQRHKDILADLARYNAMKGYSSMAEAGAALIGQFLGGVPTPESMAGPIGKGLTWGARFVSGAWRQSLVAGTVDPLVQAQSIAGGAQEKYDPWRTATSVGIGAVIGGTGAALFGQRLVPKALDGSSPPPHAPESLPPGVKGEETVSVVPKFEVQAVTSHEAPASPMAPGDKEHGLILTEAQPPKSDAQGVALQETSTPSLVSAGKGPSGQVLAEAQTLKPTAKRSISLKDHEDSINGYHAIERHVEITIEGLHTRLRTSRLRAASKYVDLAEAETITQMVLDKRGTKIQAWLQDPKQSDPLPVYIFNPISSPDYFPIGLVLERRSSTLKPGSGAIVVLNKDPAKPDGYGIITSYPTLKRPRRL